MMFYGRLLATLFVVTLSAAKQQEVFDSCIIGEVVENDCIRCVCTQNVYECTALKCNKSVGGDLSDAPACTRSMVYVQNETTCVCGKDGKWPHKICRDIFHILPTINTTKETCEPNTYVFIDCNVCRCNEFGEIDQNKCTKNVCEKDKLFITRKSGTIDSVNGKCQPRNWYSFAPCQFCYCVKDNKLVCNTGNRLDSKSLELGSYKLVVCGENLMSDAQGLISDQNFLREGNKKVENNYVQKPKPEVKPLAERYPPAQANRDIQLLKNFNTKEKLETDYESDSDEDRKDNTVNHVTPGRGVPSTQAPLEDDEEIISDESNEIAIKNDEIIQPGHMNDIPLLYVPEVKGAKTSGGQPKEKDKVLRINFPLVLDKLLNMALRRNMVKLDPDVACQPGSTIYRDCNVCYCLNNGKILCTDNICKKEDN